LAVYRFSEVLAFFKKKIWQPCVVKVSDRFEIVWCILDLKDVEVLLLR